MKYQEAFDNIVGMRLDDIDTLTFKCGVLLFLGLNNGFDESELQKETNYELSEVQTILNNLKENKILVGGAIQADFLDEEEGWMEFILTCMCGAGEIVRLEAEEQKSEILKPTINMSKRKTLNETLFDTLDRLSNADGDDIDLEVQKAVMIIEVSKQVIDVSRLKLEIMSNDFEDSFTEIDVKNTLQIEGSSEVETEISKKKLNPVKEISTTPSYSKSPIPEKEKPLKEEKQIELYRIYRETESGKKYLVIGGVFSPTKHNELKLSKATAEEQAKKHDAKIELIVN